MRRGVIFCVKVRYPMSVPKANYVDSNTNARLWVSDCLKIIPRLPAVDLFFMDPPFNLGVDYDDTGGASDRKSKAAYLTFMHQCITMGAKSLRPGGTMFVHVPDHVAGHARVWLENSGLIPVNWIILHQEFGQFNASRFITSKVHLLYFVAPPYKARTWNVQEVLEPSKRLTTYNDPRVKTSKLKGFRPLLDVWGGPMFGRIQGNNMERRKGHCNQLPELYLGTLIRAASKPGDLVFDPFMGSGTTGVVARALKRRAWGCELVPKNAKSAWQRIMKGPVRDVSERIHASSHKFV